MSQAATDYQAGRVITRPRYTDKFRASCVLMLEAAGYPEKDDTLRTVARAVDVEPMTLRRWFRGENNPMIDMDATQQRVAITTLLEDIAHKYAVHTLDEDVIEKTGALASMTTAAIAIDKLRLLQELSGEATAALREFQAAASLAGVDGLDMLRRLTARLNQQAEASTSALLGEGATTGVQP